MDSTNMKDFQLLAIQNEMQIDFPPTIDLIYLRPMYLIKNLTIDGKENGYLVFTMYTTEKMRRPYHLVKTKKQVPTKLQGLPYLVLSRR